MLNASGFTIHPRLARNAAVSKTFSANPKFCQQKFPHTAVFFFKKTNKQHFVSKCCPFHQIPHHSRASTECMKPSNRFLFFSFFFFFVFLGFFFFLGQMGTCVNSPSLQSFNWMHEIFKSFSLYLFFFFFFFLVKWEPVRLFSFCHLECNFQKNKTGETRWCVVANKATQEEFREIGADWIFSNSLSATEKSWAGIEFPAQLPDQQEQGLTLRLLSSRSWYNIHVLLWKKVAVTRTQCACPGYRRWTDKLIMKAKPITSSNKESQRLGPG